MLREEFDTFVEVLWEDGSLDGFYENGMPYLAFSKGNVTVYGKFRTPTI